MMYVKKLNGELQKYDASKLKKSLLNAGADAETANKIIKKVDAILYDGIETKKIFKFALREFKSHKPYGSLRYNLKNSILRLDSEGFHFEKLVAKIFQRLGYSVEMNQIVRGKYIQHEIDICAEKSKEKIMVECKHHAKPWLGTDIQTALYVYARFVEVKKWFSVPMLVTNTKFSPQVLAYSKGVGLKLMGWNFPAESSLKHYIEKFKLYPVTMLSMLDRKEMCDLLKAGILLTSELDAMSITDISRILKVSKPKANKILKSSKALCD
jgi:hypothetical protein